MLHKIAFYLKGTLPVTDRAACLRLTFSTKPYLSHSLLAMILYGWLLHSSPWGISQAKKFPRSGNLKPPSGTGCYGCQDLIQIDTGKKKKNVAIKNK